MSGNGSRHRIQASPSLVSSRELFKNQLILKKLEAERLRDSSRNHHPGHCSTRKIRRQSYNGPGKDPPLTYRDSHSELFRFRLPSRYRDPHCPARNVRADAADSAPSCRQPLQTPTDG